MTTESLILIALLALFLISVGWFIRLEMKLKRLVTGTNKEDLATGLRDAQEQKEDLGAFKERTQNALRDLDGRLKRSVQYIGTVRFDALKGSGGGGNQSFAVALLDESKSGVVISTIHARERVAVFSKPVKNGTSEYELTPEESSAITKAGQQ